jgi:hypothetical protein
MGQPVSARDGKLCIYPGCERPAVPAHPLGGPQPSFCDLEAHNALTAHLERQRLASAGRIFPTTVEKFDPHDRNASEEEETEDGG